MQSLTKYISIPFKTFVSKVHAMFVCIVSNIAKRHPLKLLPLQSPLYSKANTSLMLGSLVIIVT